MPGEREDFAALFSTLLVACLWVCSLLTASVADAAEETPAKDIICSQLLTGLRQLLQQVQADAQLCLRVQSLILLAEKLAAQDTVSSAPCDICLPYLPSIALCVI